MGGPGRPAGGADEPQPGGIAGHQGQAGLPDEQPHGVRPGPPGVPRPGVVCAVGAPHCLSVGRLIGFRKLLVMHCFMEPVDKSFPSLLRVCMLRADLMQDRARKGF